MNPIHMLQECEENILLHKRNEIQINLAKRFRISIEEFAAYYSESFAKQWDKFVNWEFPEKTDWLILQNKIFYYMDRNYMAGAGKSYEQETKEKVNTILIK